MISSFFKVHSPKSARVPSRSGEKNQIACFFPFGLVFTSNNNWLEFQVCCHLDDGINHVAQAKFMAIINMELFSDQKQPPGCPVVHFVSTLTTSAIPNLQKFVVVIILIVMIRNNQADITDQTSSKHLVTFEQTKNNYLCKKISSKKI